MLAGRGLAADLCVALPAVAATDAECQAMWSKADVNKDGTLSADEAMRYSAAMRVKEKQVSADGKIDQAAFMESCKSDVYIDQHGRSPAHRSSGFQQLHLEGHAKRPRPVMHGMTVRVSALKKDDDGIWRGTAPAGRQARAGRRRLPRATSFPRPRLNPIRKVKHTMKNSHVACLRHALPGTGMR